MIDIGQAEAFVSALTGSPHTPMVFQLAQDREEGDRRPINKNLTRVIIGSVRDHAAILGRMNDLGAAVWVQINEGGRRVSAVTGLRALFVDDDGKHEDPPSFALAPSIVVATSAGIRNRHYYWTLRGGESVERFVPAQKQLISCLHTDRSIHNLDRVMRLPGTVNRKPSKDGQPARLVYVDPTHRIYTIDELLTAHPISPDEQTRLAAEPQPDLFTEPALAMARRIAFWLTERGVSFVQNSPISFRLARCVFNPAHLDKMAIKVQSRGGVWAGCFHDSCGGNVNRWPAIKDRVGGWAGGTIAFHRGDGAEIAARLLADLSQGSTEPLVHDEGQLWRYAPARGLWESVTESEQEKIVLGYAGLPVGDGKKRIRIGAGVFSDALRCVRPIASQSEFFAEASPGIAFANGFLAVTPAGAAFMPHSPDHRQRVGLSYSYDPRAMCARFFRYLVECFRDDADAPQKIDILQEFLGACLVGVAPRFAKALMLSGEGDNGKSVFTSVAFELFPPSMRQAIRPQDFGHEYYRARLAGARVNIVAEVPESDILSSDSFNAIITGDPITGRDPTGKPFSFRMVAGQIFAANRLPATASHTHGFWRRQLVVPFGRTFTEEEKDRGLTEYLVANEMPGIVVWVVRGAERLLARGGYSIPESSNEALRAWRREVDPVLQFLDECTMLEGGDFSEGAEGTKAIVLYTTFQEWTRTHGHKIMSSTSFGRRLRAHKIPKKDRGDGAYYGIKLTVAPPPLAYLT